MSIFRRQQKNLHPSLIEKWTRISPYGKPLKREMLNRDGEPVQVRIVPFKTPFSKDYDHIFSEDQRLHPDQLIRHYQEQNIHFKGMINLCYSNRFYQPYELDIKDYFFQYRRMNFKGFTEPTQDFLNRINLYMQKFENLIIEDNEYVGVHCTQGYNRTGLVIVNYLCQVKNVDLDTALNEFNLARSPEKLDKEMYLKYLHDTFQNDLQNNKNNSFEDTRVKQ
eukprot:403343839